jgi:Flp pilus assembly pilin Flp
MPSAVAWFICLCAPYVRARFGRTQRGSSLVEYVLLVMLIAMVCLAAVTYFGQANSTKVSDIGSRVG